MILCPGETLTWQELPPEMQRYDQPWPEGEAESGLPELERELISRTLTKLAGDRRQAAAVLGISLEELNLKMRAYHLED